MIRFMLSAALLMALPLSALAAWQDKVDPRLLRADTQLDWLIELPNTADLSPADAIPDKTLKGAFVIETLKAQANATQPAVAAVLDARGLNYRRFWIANSIHVIDASPADLQAVAELAAVDRIHAVEKPVFSAPEPGSSATPASRTAKLDAASGFEVEPSLELVRATEVWAMGFEGQGAVVGDHDIGVEWTHPALQAKYRGWDAATGNATHDFNWRNAFDAADPFCPPDEPCDSNSHGTHTTGTMVGEDLELNLRIGMAPKAQWMGCRSLYDPVVGLGTVPTYLDCMEWFVAPYPINDPAGADPAMAPDVINNSWGCLEGCVPGILAAADEATRAAGIVQVSSAGNEGPDCSTIAFPLAIYSSSFTIGSSTIDDTMSSFSSRGPVASDLSMRLKPNVVAPGSSINSSELNGSYGTKSGTSMAAPHVSGLVALMISAQPRLRGQVDVIRALIQQTAVPITNDQSCGDTGPQDIPNNVFGYGRIDAAAAVQAALELYPAVDGSTDNATGEGRANASSLTAVQGGSLGGWLVLLGMGLTLRRRR